MNNILISIRMQFSRKPHMFVGLLIFLSCLFVYLANGQPGSSGDNIPSSLLAFQWLFKQTLNFDIFRNSYWTGQAESCINCANGLPYYFVEAPNGHLTSTYPIGNALVSFPIYVFFFVILKLYNAVHFSITAVSLLPDILDPNFDIFRQHYEKLAAAILTAASAVLFYLCAVLKFQPGVALLTTFIYAFATNTWAINSQGLWQHSAANFVLLCVVLCLLKANRTVEYRPRLLLAAGFFAGLIPGCRPTSILFLIAVLLYCVFTYGRETKFFLLGLPSLLFSSSWNFYYFGFSLKNFLVAGYSRFSNTSFTASFYKLTPQQFLEGFLGLLISPSRGLFVYSPVLLLAIPGGHHIWQLRWKPDERLLGSLTIAALLIFLQYCIYTIWWGGWCYGPRFLTDVVPVLCLLVGYCLTVGLEWLEHHRRQLLVGATAVVLSLTVLSTAVQVVGVFGSTNWDGIPVGNDTSRLWQWQDSQIQRHANRLFHRVHRPIEKPRKYLRRTDGVIETVKAIEQTANAPIQAKPAQPVILKAELINKGKTQWYGYQTAMGRGETRIQVQFFDANATAVEIGLDNLLYVSGMIEPQEEAEAIGEILFPAQPGEYQMVLTPFVQGLGKFPKYEKKQRLAYETKAIVFNPS